MEKKELYLQIGEGIRKAREKKKYTQEVLADKIGVSPQFISDIERGVVGLSLIKYRALCLALSVSSDQLLFGEQPDAVAGLMNQLVELNDDAMGRTGVILEEIIDLYRTAKR